MFLPSIAVKLILPSAPSNTQNIAPFYFALYLDCGFLTNFLLFLGCLVDFLFFLTLYSIFNCFFKFSMIPLVYHKLPFLRNFPFYPSVLRLPAGQAAFSPCKFTAILLPWVRSSALRPMSPSFWVYFLIIARIHLQITFLKRIHGK